MAPPENTLYSEGKTNNVSSVDENSPPTTTVASGFFNFSSSWPSGWNPSFYNRINTSLNIFSIHPDPSPEGGGLRIP